jgi:hypothetical protein
MQQVAEKYYEHYMDVGFKVFMVTMDLMDLISCSSERTWHFGGAYHLHLQDWILAKQETYLLRASVGCLFDLHFDSKDGGDMLHSNVGLSTNDTAFQPRRSYTLHYVDVTAITFP